MITLEEAYKSVAIYPAGAELKIIKEKFAEKGIHELPKIEATRIFEADDCWGFIFKNCFAMFLVFKSDGHKCLAPTCPGDDPRDYVELPQEVLEELKKKFD